MRQRSDATASVLGIDTREGWPLIRASTGVVIGHPGVYEELTTEENLEWHNAHRAAAR